MCVKRRLACAVAEPVHLLLCRYHAVLFPITAYICNTLPESSRASTSTELFFEDFDKLPPEEVAKICEWLTDKVDGFSAKTKQAANELEEEEVRELDQGLG